MIFFHSKQFSFLLIDFQFKLLCLCSEDLDLGFFLTVSFIQSIQKSISIFCQSLNRLLQTRDILVFLA